MDRSHWEEGIRLCVKCHAKVHYFISNWELAARFNTAEKLIEEMKLREAENKRVRRASPVEVPIPVGKRNYKVGMEDLEAVQ